MFLYFVCFFISICYSCFTNTCSKCENQIVDFKSFLIEGSFKNDPCFGKMKQYSGTCNSGECVTYLSILYSSNDHSRTFKDLASHMISIKRDCQKKTTDSKCNWKSFGNRYLTYCNIICNGYKCNSNSVFEEIFANNIYRFIPTCIGCQMEYDHNSTIINNTCNAPDKNSIHKLCFGKCFSVIKFKDKTILLDKGCINDLNGYVFKNKYGILNIKELIVYSLCSVTMDMACNEFTKQFPLNVTQLKSMYTNLNKDVSEQTICLSCKTSRFSHFSETNCEKGIQSSVFNIVKCTNVCYTEFVKYINKIKVTRGCGIFNEKKRGIPKNVKNKYQCNDCFSTCKPRSKFICNSKHYVISNENLPDIHFPRIGDKIKFMKIENTNVSSYMHSNYILKVANKVTSKIGIYNNRKYLNNIKFMKESTDEILNEKDIKTMQDFATNVTNKATPIANKLNIVGLGLMEADNKKEHLLSLLNKEKEIGSSKELDNAISEIENIDENLFTEIFSNDDYYNVQKENKLFKEYMKSLNKLIKMRNEEIYVYNALYVGNNLAVYIMDLETEMKTQGEIAYQKNRVLKYDTKIENNIEEFKEDLQGIYRKIKLESIEIANAMKLLINAQLKIDTDTNFNKLNKNIKFILTKEIKIQNMKDVFKNLNMQKNMPVHEKSKTDKKMEDETVKNQDEQVKEILLKMNEKKNEESNQEDKNEATTIKVEQQVNKAKEINNEIDKLIDVESPFYKKVYATKISTLINELKLFEQSDKEIDDISDHINENVLYRSNEEKELYRQKLFDEINILHSDFKRISQYKKHKINNLLKLDPELKVEEKLHYDKYLRSVKNIDNIIINKVKELNKLNDKLRILNKKINKRVNKSKMAKYKKNIADLENQIKTYETHLIDLVELKDTKYVDVLQLFSSLYDKKIANIDDDNRQMVEWLQYNIGEIEQNIIHLKSDLINIYENGYDLNKIMKIDELIKQSKNKQYRIIRNIRNKESDNRIRKNVLEIMKDYVFLIEKDNLISSSLRLGESSPFLLSPQTTGTLKFDNEHFALKTDFGHYQVLHEKFLTDGEKIILKKKKKNEQENIQKILIEKYGLKVNDPTTKANLVKLNQREMISQAKKFADNKIKIRENKRLFGRSRVTNIRKHLKKKTILGSAIVGITLVAGSIFLGFENMKPEQNIQLSNNDNKYHVDDKIKDMNISKKVDYEENDYSQNVTKFFKNSKMTSDRKPSSRVIDSVYNVFDYNDNETKIGETLIAREPSMESEKLIWIFAAAVVVLLFIFIVVV